MKFVLLNLYFISVAISLGLVVSLIVFEIIARHNYKYYLSLSSVELVIRVVGSAAPFGNLLIMAFTVSDIARAMRHMVNAQWRAWWQKPYLPRRNP